MKHGIMKKPGMRHLRRESSDEKKRKALFLPYRRALPAVFAVASMLTVLITAYSLKLPAITASYAECGLEEHTHTDSCYGRELICENAYEDHIYSDECFGEEPILICGKDQHIHSDECYHTEEDIAPVGDGEDTDPGYDLSGYTDLEEYLLTVNGYVESDLYDSSGNLIDNIFEAAGTGYSYEFSVTADYIISGDYYYAMPKNMTPDDDVLTGGIYYKGEEIGSFRMEPGIPYLFFTFSENINSYQNITGELSFGCSFTARIKPSVSKTGYIISPDNVFDRYFHFAVQAKIPAAGEGVPKREWKLLDRSKITIITEQVADVTEWYHDFGSEINAPNTNIYISYGNAERYELHPLQEVFDDDSVSIAYYADSASSMLYLVNRCTCDGARCVHMADDECGGGLLSDYDGWCTCWNLEDDAKLDIEYKNVINGADGSIILKDQQELANTESSVYSNTIILKGTYVKNGVTYNESKMASADVDFTAVVDKSEAIQARNSNGLQSTFSIVINPQKADFSKLDVDGDGHYDDELIGTVAANIADYDTYFYAFKDTLSAGLTYDASKAAVQIGLYDVESGSYEFVADVTSLFTVSAANVTDGTEVTFACENLLADTFPAITPSSVIIVRYNAELNENAEIGAAGNPNKAVLVYSNRPENSESLGYTEPDEVVVYTYSVRFEKIDSYDGNGLKGAKFRLQNSEGKYYTADSDGTRWTDSEDDADLLISDDNGIIEVVGLDKGQYTITEIASPTGYKLLEGSITFTINAAILADIDVDLAQQYLETAELSSPALAFSSADYGVTVEIDPENSANAVVLSSAEQAASIARLQIANIRLYNLPETGGRGTLFFYAGGALLIAAAIAVLILRAKAK